jgi:tape measure domain-containing protein
MEENPQGIEVGAVILPIEAAVGDFLTTMRQLPEEVAKMPCVPVKICPDIDHLQSSIKKLRLDCIPVELCLDDRKLQSDLAGLKRSVELTATIDLRSVQGQIDAIAAQPRTIYYSAEVDTANIQSLQQKLTVNASAQGLGDAINPELKKAFKDASKELKGGNLLGAVSGIATVPFKAIGGLASQAISGALFGVGQQLTGGFAKGLTTSISGKLEGSIGSLEFLGERSGDLISALVNEGKKAATNKIGKINDALNEYIETAAPEFKGLKKELDEAVVLGIEDYFDAFEQAFPQERRIVEAAAQRASLQRRRSQVSRQAQPQVVQENQEQLRTLALRQAQLNQQAAVVANRRQATVQVTRDERQDVAQRIRQTVVAQSDPSVRAEILKNAALEIPKKFQKQLELVQENYKEALEAVNEKTLQIADAEAQSAALGIPVNPETKKQRAQDLDGLVQIANEKKRQVATVENGIQAEVSRYTKAAETGEGSDALLKQLQAELTQQIKILGEPLRLINEQRNAIQEEIEQIKSRRVEVVERFKSIASPELQRQGLESSIGRSQTKLTKVSTNLDTAQNRLAEIQANPNENNLREVDFLQTSIKSLSKEKTSLERKIVKDQDKLALAPKQTAKAIQEVFDVILGATVPLEKLPLVIVDETRAVEANAKAFYSAFENVIILNQETAKQVSKGQLIGQQLQDTLEEASHALQFDFGSAKGLEALSTRRGETLTPLNQVSIPTARETAAFAPELQNYPQKVRQVELEAKVNAQRKREEIEARREAQSLSRALENSAGLGGNTLAQTAKARISKSRNQLAEIQGLANDINVDISSSINDVGAVISSLEDGVKKTLEDLAVSSISNLPLDQIESLKNDYLGQIKGLNELDSELAGLTRVLKTKLTEKQSASAEKESTAIAKSPETVGSALESVTSSVIIPAAKTGGNALISIGKTGYKLVESFEALVLDIIPAGRAIKATTKFVAKNIAIPAGVAATASQIPGVGGLEHVAVSAAGDLIHQLVGLTREGIFGQVHSIIDAAIPKFIPGSQNIVSIVTERITALATKTLDATGTATAEGLTTVLSGSAVLNILKKGVNKGIDQASRALPAAGQSIGNSEIAQNILNTPIPFNLPEKEKVLEFAENVGMATRQVFDAASNALEPVVNKVAEAAERIQQIDKAEAVQIANDLGKKTRLVVDNVVETIDDAIAAVELVSAKIPGGQRLVDLSKTQLEGLKRQLETKFERASTAESEGRPVIGGSDSIRGDIERVQRVIEAKAEVIPDIPKISPPKEQLQNIIKAESKQIEKLRAQLIENLRSGATADALLTAEQLKSSSKIALGKLQSFQSSDQFNLEPEIRKSVNGYISRFKDLIAQADNATAKISNNEDFGKLLSINTQQLAERFTGLVNNLFEVEGKNLQDALGKAATSPRAKDLYVNTAGFAASQIGGQHGIVPQLGGDIGGAIAARGAIHIGEQALESRAELLGTELYSTASTIEKLKLITEATIKKLQQQSVQGVLGDRLTEDLSGFTVGSLAGIIGNKGIEATLGGSVPGLGAIAAGGIVPKLSDIRKEINARLSQQLPELEEGVLRSAKNQPAYSDKDIDVLREIEAQLTEIERLTQKIEGGQRRVNQIEREIGATEDQNRRNLRFTTVEQDQKQREASKRLEEIKAEQRLEAQIANERRNRLTSGDLTTVLTDIAPRPQEDRLLQLKRESEAEQAALADRLNAIKKEGEEERRIQEANTKAKEQDLSERLALIKKENEAAQQQIIAPQKVDPIISAKQDFDKQQSDLERQRDIGITPKNASIDDRLLIASKSAFTQERNQIEVIDRLQRAKDEAEATRLETKLIQIKKINSETKQGLILPPSVPARAVEDIKPERAVDRLAQIKAESEAQQQSLSDRLAILNEERKAEQNAVNERLKSIKVEAEAEKIAQQDLLVERLKFQQTVGTRDRLAASALPRQKEDLSQFLTRVPGTAAGGGGGRGSKPPGPPTLFIPEIEPRVTVFEVAKKAATGLLGVVEKIPSPIKNIFALLGGGFVGLQAFQIIQQQAGAAYESIKRLETARVVVKFATGSTDALTQAENQSKRLGTRLDQSRDAIKSLAIQAKNTPLETQVTPIFKGASTAAAALQLNSEQQNRLFLAFNQIAGKGTVQSEELRQQLGELGISFQLAARAAGLTTQEFNKQLEQGAILSQDFLPKFARQIQIELGGAAISAGDSLQGLENKTANAAQKLQEAFGEKAVPVASTGLRVLSSGLELAANNIQIVTTLINAGLVVALAKGASALSKFAFEKQAFSEFDLKGNIVGQTSSSRAGRVTGGVVDFVKQGGIQQAIKSPIAQELGSVAVQAGLVTAAIGTFQTLAENFSGGQALQDYNKQLEVTEQRLKAIKDGLSKPEELGRRTNQQIQGSINNYAAKAFGDLFSLNVSGFQKNLANAFSERTGNDTSQVFGTALVTAEQSTNSRVLLKGLETLSSKNFNDEYTAGIQIAQKLKNKNVEAVPQTKADIRKDPKLKQRFDQGLIVSQEDLSASREGLQAYREQLASIPEAIINTPEGKPIREEIKQLDKLIKNLGGEGSAYAKLTVAAQKYQNVTQRQIELEKAQSALLSSRGRASGQTNEFQAKLEEIESQSNAAAKNKAALADLERQSNEYLASKDFAALRVADPAKALEKEQQNIELKTQIAAADKQIEDGITQVRLENVNRRSELLQREVAEQERSQAKLEGTRRLTNTGRDADLSQGFAAQNITPQSLKLVQIDNTQSDARSAFEEQIKRRADALKNLKQAQKDLQRINPNDEQQFEQGKATVAQYEQAVLAAGAEINNQRKAYFEAEKQRQEELLSQAGQVSELAARKEELSVDRRIKAVERLGSILKRDSDNRITDIERQNKLISKQGELLTAQNNIVQVRGGGRVSGLKTAEDLARQIQEPKEETEKDKKLKRDRLKGILGDLGVGFSEEKIFQRRVDAENQLAKTKEQALNLELNISAITLEREQKKEEIVRRSAITQAQAAERIARSNLEKSGISVQKAEIGLDLAKRSGDPLKVREAQLTLEQAQLDYSSAAGELPNATNAVNQALMDLAQSIKESELQRSLINVQGDTKRTQFGLEERDRGLSTRIEAANKGFGKPIVKDASGLVSGLSLKNDPSRRLPDGFSSNTTGVNTYAPDLRLLSRAGAVSPVPLPKFDYASPGPDPGGRSDQLMGGFEKLFTPLTESVNLQKAMVQLLSMIQNKPVAQITKKTEVQETVYQNPFEGLR